MTRPTHSIMVAAVLSVLCASAAGCSSAPAPVTARPEHLIAWDDAVASQLEIPQLPPSPNCAASRLRVAGPGFQFVAGVAGGTAAVALRNIGPGRCRLTGYPTVRLAGAPRAPAQRQVDLPAQAPAFPEILEPAASLRALAPGATAILGIEWSNWCVPGAAGSRQPQVPPRTVLISLGKGLGSLDVNYNAVPPCDAPWQPSTIGVRPFTPAPLPASQPWTTANVKATIQSADGPRSPLTAKRGRVARFVIRLQNTSPVTVRFAPCPLIAEVLAPSGQTEVHQLNCQAAGPISPGGSLFFEMRIVVPPGAPLGKNGLLWELDPTGAAYPEAISGLVVTR
jgi:Protein of unknown function (DUF4232)